MVLKAGSPSPCGAKQVGRSHQPDRRAVYLAMQDGRQTIAEYADNLSEFCLIVKGILSLKGAGFGMAKKRGLSSLSE